MTARRRLFKAVQITLSFVLLGLAVWVARPAALWREMLGVNGPWLLLSLLFVPILIALRAARWHILARTRREDMPFRKSFHSYMGGLALSIITPAAELTRGALAAPRDKAGFVGLAFLDKLIDATVLFLLACGGFGIIAPGGLKYAAPASAVLVIAGWGASRPIAAFLGNLLPSSHIAGALRRALEATHSVRPAVLVKCFLLATANFVLYYCHLYIIMYAFAPEIEPKAAALLPLITLSRLVPSIGVGPRELAAGALFSRFEYQVSSAGAVAAAFVQFVTVNVVPVAVWIILSGGFRRFFANEKKHNQAG